MKKPFTPKEIKELKKSPYVTRVSNTSITYSKTFKEEFIRLYQEGLTPTEIFKELGLAPDIVGYQRISGAAQRFKQYAERPEGFANLTTEPEARKKRPKSDAQKIKELEHQVALLTQENQFLKKKRTIDRTFHK